MANTGQGGQRQGGFQAGRQLPARPPPRRRRRQATGGLRPCSPANAANSSGPTRMASSTPKVSNWCRARPHGPRCSLATSSGAPMAGAAPSSNAWASGMGASRSAALPPQFERGCEGRGNSRNACSGRVASNCVDQRCSASARCLARSAAVIVRQRGGAASPPCGTRAALCMVEPGSTPVGHPTASACSLTFEAGAKFGPNSVAGCARCRSRHNHRRHLSLIAVPGCFSSMHLNVLDGMHGLGGVGRALQRLHAGGTVAGKARGPPHAAPSCPLAGPRAPLCRHRRHGFQSLASRPAASQGPPSVGSAAGGARPSPPTPRDLLHCISRGRSSARRGPPRPTDRCCCARPAR